MCLTSGVARRGQGGPINKNLKNIDHTNRRLAIHCLLSIESDLAAKINYKPLVEDFSKAKKRNNHSSYKSPTAHLIFFTTTIKIIDLGNERKGSSLM